MPKLISESRGVLLTGFIGIALMSWELLKLGWLDTDVSLSLYSNWLVGYSSLLAYRWHHDRRLLPR